MVSYRRSFWIGLAGFISIDNKWSDLEEIGQGTAVDVITGKDGRSHFAWCDEDNKIHYLAEGSSNESLDPSSCGAPPALVEEAMGRMHLIYAAEQLTNNFDMLNNVPSLVKTIKTEAGWSQPALVALVDLP